MNRSGTLYIGNSHEVRLTVGRNELPASTATVTMTLEDEGGVPVGGQAWPTPMVLDTPGVYTGGLQGGLDLEPGKRYFMVVRAVLANGLQLLLRRRVQGGYRQG